MERTHNHTSPAIRSFTIPAQMPEINIFSQALLKVRTASLPSPGTVVWPVVVDCVLKTIDIRSRHLAGSFWRSSPVKEQHPESIRGEVSVSFSVCFCLHIPSCPLTSSEPSPRSLFLFLSLSFSPSPQLSFKRWRRSVRTLVPFSSIRSCFLRVLFFFFCRFIPDRSPFSPLRV